MLKNFVKSLFFSGMLFSTFAVTAEVDITEILQAADFAILDEHEVVVLLIPDAMKALEFVCAPENSDLHDLKVAVQKGINVAPYDKALSAVEQAIRLFADVDSAGFKSLNAYRSMLLNGDATLFVKDDMLDRGKRESKKFCRICVKTLTATCADICNLTAGTISGSNTCCPTGTAAQCNTNNVLCITSNANVCGNLNVGGTISTAGLIFTTPCNATTAANVLSIPDSLSVCGNVQFNTVAGTTPPTHLLSAQGAWESKLDILRGVIGFTSTAGLTLALNNLGIPFATNAFNVGGFTGVVVPTLVSGAPAQFVFSPASNDITVNANLASFSSEGVLGFKTRVNFGLTFTAIPAIELTPTIDDVTSLINVTTVDNKLGSVSLAEFMVAASNVDTTGFDLLILVFPISHEFQTVPQINGAIGGAGSNLLINLFNNLQINILVDGKVS